MSYAVRVPDAKYVWLDRVHVEEGQSIAPGIKIADVMLPDGVMQTIKSDCHGIIAHIEEAASEGYFEGGAMICHIAKRGDRSTRDGKLHPRPAVALRKLRLGF